jgi:hypothetical protein
MKDFMTAMGWATIEHPEPNGPYNSKNTDATWVLCAYGGKVTPVYVEHKVLAYPLTVDYTTGSITRAGESSIILEVQP